MMVLQAIRYIPAEASAASLEILNQLALPHRSTYLPICTCEDAWNAIRRMNVRGAPAIAIVAALSLAVELSRQADDDSHPTAESLSQSIQKRLLYLQSSRPTAVNLGNAVGKLRAVVESAKGEDEASSSTVAKAYVVAAEKMLLDDVADNVAIGQHGARWIRENTKAGKGESRARELKIVTHCNTGSLATAGYGTALGVIRSLRDEKILTHAFCSETRPYNQGSRLTAYELLHDKIPATLITDSMVANLLAKEGDSVAAVVVGADRVAANGDTANKIGTYSLAVLARYHGVKFLVAAPKTTIDLATASGKHIVVEERPNEEVARIQGHAVDAEGRILAKEEPVTVSIAPAGINVWNPAFDVTPAALIDGIATELGVVEKGDGENFDFTSIFNHGIET